MICNKLISCADGQIKGPNNISCPNDRSKCIVISDDRSNVKCEERNKRYILENTEKNHVILYRVDGGVILQDRSVPQGTAKCDYMFVINRGCRDVILTELKGVDVKHAIEQINGILLQFKDFFDECGHVYGRAVVTSSTPKIKAMPKYVNLQKTLNRYNGNFKIAEKQMREKDTELARSL